MVTSRSWFLEGAQGLALEPRDVPEPTDHEILIKFHAFSLNYRDVLIGKGNYNWATHGGIVIGSDGAGEVVKAGPKVTRFTVGQRVSPIFFPTYTHNPITWKDMESQLGSHTDGTLREYAVFNEQSCVVVPDNYTYAEAATLPCAALTAYNALFGGPRALRPGETVLTQGTGGVSVFALQFAKLAGAEVISTTSDSAKAEKLKSLGASHVINYKDDPEWGTTAKKLTKNGRGIDFVVEIGGPNTLIQSCKAIALDGTVQVIGRRGGTDAKEVPKDPMCTVRRIMVGSRALQEEMNRTLEINNMKPIIDPKSFKFDQMKEAIDYLAGQGHFGKVVVEM